MIQVSGSSFAVRTTAPPNVTGMERVLRDGSGGDDAAEWDACAPGETWVQPDTLSSNGRRPGSGQAPTYRLPVPRMIQRG